LYKTDGSKEIARIFVDRIIRQYGAPDSIVSDRGPQFISAFWAEVNRILRVEIKLSTANHPETDGQTEIMNKYIYQRLRPFINHFQDDWDELMPMMDYAQASLPSDTTGFSPIEIELGYTPRATFDWSEPDKPPRANQRLSNEEAKAITARLANGHKIAKQYIEQSQDAQRKQANKKRREIDFKKDDMVWVTTKYWS
jgi:transposase InsO family protein